MIAAVWVAYFACAALNVFALTRIDPRRLTFMDGVLIGLTYYITLPMFFILAHGGTTMEDIGVDYLPFADIKTTKVILTGMILIPLLQLWTSYTRPPEPSDQTDQRLLGIMFVLFVATTIASFFLIGLGQGGHWSENAGEAFQANASVVYVRHFANFARTAIFGLLLYANLNRGVRVRTVLAIGLVVVLIDLFLTFNRITAAYFLVMIAIMLRRRIGALVALITAVIFGGSTVSNMWPMFRGLATQSGYTFSGVLDAAEISFESSAVGVPLADSINGVFESSNLVVLNFIVEHGGARIPTFAGEMFLRQIFFFLPRAIWRDRPDNFGIVIGSAMTDISGLALNSTIIGEPYANFGPLWFLALAGLLLAYHYLFRLLGQRSRAVGFIAAFTAFAMWRFDTVFGMISLTLTGLILLGLSVVRTRQYRSIRSTIRRVA